MLAQGKSRPSLPYVVTTVMLAAITLAVWLGFGDVSAHPKTTTAQTDNIFNTQQLIFNAASEAVSVYAAKINQDGRVDVISASRGDDQIRWYKNELNTTGKFALPVSFTAADPYSVVTADLDQDQDQDIIVALGWPDEIVWYENLDGAGSFGSRNVINTPANVSAFFVTTADLDGDDDVDVLAAHQGDVANNWQGSKIAWYENDLNQGGDWITHTISANVGRAYAVFAADLDSDDDLDFLAALAEENKIVWYENLDGMGNWGGQNLITDSANFAAFVTADDVNGDLAMDVLAASTDDHTVAWYENTKGDGSQWTKHTITSALIQPNTIVTGDVDRDHDPDVIVSSFLEGNPAVNSKITLYLNDGNGLFSQSELIAQEPAVQAPADIHLADLDGDGFLDLAAASSADNLVSWYENNQTSRVYLPLALHNFINYYKPITETEDNDVKDQANGPIRSDQDYTGLPNDAYDYFYFTSLFPGPITVDVTGQTGSGVQLLLVSDALPPPLIQDYEPPFHIDLDNAPAATYYVVVYTASGFNDAPYTLRVTYPTSP